MRGVAQLGHRLGDDLPDLLPGQPVDVADVIERARVAVGEPGSQPDNAGVALGQRGKYVQLFVTIGSPLAVPEVEGLVAHPLEVPIGVNQWVNVAAAFDPVALDPTLADDYPPPSKCTDHMILNLPDPHSSDGYLRSHPVRTAIDPLFAIPSP